MYTVYMHINRVNGKKYVGYTSKSWQERWKDHCKSARNVKHFYFHSAIKRYGEDAFDHVVLADAVPTLCAAHALERKMIAEHRSFDSTNGYNLTFGGEGCTATAATRAKLSRSLRGNEKLRAALTGRKCSDIHCANIGAVHRGRKRSAETKAKLSIALKIAWAKKQATT